MKIHYDAETDSLYIDLASGECVDSREIAEGLVADFDAQGHVVGLDFDKASRLVNLDTLEVDALPVRVSAAARSRPGR